MPENDWPADWLRETLLDLNRLHMKDASGEHLRGRDSWPNQQHAQFAEELALAKSLNIRPVRPGDSGFRELLKRGQRFNWVIQLDGRLSISPSIVMTDDGPVRISHAVLCYNGGEVLAAGEGREGDYLSNTTGHYKNEDFVIAPVKRAFAMIGVHFGE